MYDYEKVNQERVSAITALFGQPKTDAQRRYLEELCRDNSGSAGCYAVAARAYAAAFGTKRFPDIDVLCGLAMFYGGLADGGHDTFEDDPEYQNNRDLLRRMSWHCAELATMEHAKALAKGDVAVEKMKKFGRALLGTASSIAPNHR